MEDADVAWIEGTRAQNGTCISSRERKVVWIYREVEGQFAAELRHSTRLRETAWLSARSRISLREA